MAQHQYLYSQTSHPAQFSSIDPLQRSYEDEKYLGFSSGYPILADLLQYLNLPRSTQSPRFTSDSWLYGLVTSTDVPQIPIPSKKSIDSMFELVHEIVTPIYPLFTAKDLQRLIEDVYLNGTITRTDVSQITLSGFTLAYALALNIMSRKDQNLSALLMPSVNFSRAGFKELISSPSQESIWCLMSLVVLNHACDLTTPVWYATGSAMRMCIELELYKQSPTAAVESVSDAENFRRRIFWTTYGIERGLCMILGRPVDRLDHLITCPYPTDVPSRALNRYKIRRIQSEILQQLSNQVTPLPPSNEVFRDWERKITDWFHASEKSPEERLQYSNTLLLILRPGVYAKDPAASHKSVEIVIGNLGIYMMEAIEISITEGILLVHDLFLNITTLLYAYVHCSGVRGVLGFGDLLERLDSTRGLLIDLGRRWRAARESLELMDSIVERMSSAMTEGPGAHFPYTQFG